MKVQFSVKINTHQPRDWSKCTNLNFNTNHKGEIQPTTRSYTPKKLHVATSLVKCLSQSLAQFPVLSTTMDQEPSIQRLPYRKAKNPRRTFLSLKSAHVHYVFSFKRLSVLFLKTVSVVSLLSSLWKPYNINNHVYKTAIPHQFLAYIVLLKFCP